MKCEKCNYNIPDGLDTCNLCGHKVKKESKIKLVEEDKVVNQEVIHDQYLAITPHKLAILSFVTLGLYEFYWFYKNWKVVQKHQEKKIYPFWRAIFSVFFCYSLFKKIFQSAKAQGYTQYSPGYLASAYIGILIIGEVFSELYERLGNSFLDYLSLISLFSFIPLMAVQKVINYNNRKIDSSYQPDHKFSGWEVLIIVIGVIIFLIVILGTIFGM